MPRNRSGLVALLAGVLLVLSLTGASCGDKRTMVSLGAATRGTVDEIVEASGSVTARAAATVSSPADGTLADLRVTVGSRVRKGQVVAVIDSPSPERRLADAAQALEQVNSVGVPSGAGTSGFTTVQQRTDGRAGAAFGAARDAAQEVTDPDLKKAMLSQVDAAAGQYTAASEAAAAAIRSVQQASRT